MLFICHFCNREVIDPLTTAAGHDEKKVEFSSTQTCDYCGKDLRCCVNCKHYNEDAENQCTGDIEERILIKSESNSCEKFQFDAFSLLQYLKKKRKQLKGKL